VTLNEPLTQILKARRYSTCAKPLQ